MSLSEEALKISLVRTFTGYALEAVPERRVDLKIRNGDNEILWIEVKKQQLDVAGLDRAMAQMCLTAMDEQKNGYAMPLYYAVYDGETLYYIDSEKWACIIEGNQIDGNDLRASAPSSKTVLVVKKFSPPSGYLFVNKENIPQWIKSHVLPYRNERPITPATVYDIYDKWKKIVYPCLDINRKLEGVGEADYFLAAVMSEGNRTIVVTDQLPVMLDIDVYRINRKQLVSSQLPLMVDSDLELGTVHFKRGGLAVHNEFWKSYKRPPDEESRGRIMHRRNMLVDEEYRRRKGQFLKEYFRGWTEGGRLRSTSADAEFNRLITVLREKLRLLAARITEKAYVHGFLVGEYVPTPETQTMWY